MVFSQNFKKYFANTSWLLAERILRMVVALFVGVYVARYLGPEKFGELSYAASFAGLFSALAMLGLDGIVVRELVKDESRRDELLGTAFWLKLTGAILTLFFLAVVLFLTGGTAEEKILIFIIASGFLFQSTNVIDFYFQAKIQSRFVVHAQIVQVVVSSIAKITLVIIEAPLLWFAAIMLADSIILSIFLIASYTKQKNLSIRSWCFHWATAKSLLTDSWPLILAGIAVSIYMKIDQVMIRNMLNAEAVGNYAAAVKLSESWYFIPIAITSSVFPVIIHTKEINEKLYYKKLQQMYTLMVWLAVAIAIPTTFFSNDIIKLLFGDKYLKSGTVLSIHIWAGVFVFLGVATSKWLISENLTKKSLYRQSLGCTINIILNIPLISIIGINGAAIATLIAHATTNLVYDFFDNDFRQQRIIKLRAIMPISSIKNIFKYTNMIKKRSQM